MRTGSIAPRVLLILLVAGVAAAGHSSAESKPTTARVDVRLREWRVMPSVNAAGAGRVTIVVRNAGKRTHELVVIRTNRPPNALPLQGIKASEVGKQGEVDELKPGET